MSACGKKARACQNQIHTSGSKSFANQQADYVWNIYVILYLLRILVRAKPSYMRYILLYTYLMLVLPYYL